MATPFTERTYVVPDGRCDHAERDLLATHGLTEYYQCRECGSAVIVAGRWR